MGAARIDSMNTGEAYERNASVMFTDRVRRSPGRVAMVVLGEAALTYAALGERLAAAVDLLRRAGVHAGDRVALAAGNRTEVVEYMVAALHLGAVFVPLNTRLSAAELRFVIEDAGATVVLVDTAMALVLDGLRTDPGAAAILCLDDDAPHGWPTVGDTRTGEPVPLGAAADVGPDDVAVLMYTSGTTGRPKGAMISHGNIVATVHNLMLLIPMGPASGMLAMAPLFHVGAMALVLGTLATGGRVVILPSFSAAGVFDAIESQPVTFSFGVPAMLQMMTTDPRFESADLSGVLLMCAGAPVPESLLDEYLSRGAMVTQGYGLTEATAVVSLLESEFAASKLGSAGMPYPLTAVQLRDPDMREITAPDVDGEIWIKGRNVVAGYWNRPEETSELLDDDGWLRTGDAGRFDADGFLFITDRIKDMLITGGENVYPAEVEKALTGMPTVAEVAVIGTPDAQWGEIVTAVVVAQAGHEVTLEEVQAHARLFLGGYKIPRRLELIDVLPRNAAGKVLKRELRSQLS